MKIILRGGSFEDLARYKFGKEMEKNHRFVSMTKYPLDTTIIFIHSGYCMYNLYNLEANHYPESLVISFRKYLVAERVSKGTVRSYVSDVRYFFNWLISFFESNHVFEANYSSPSESSALFSLINQKVLSAYGQALRNNQVPLKTINRRFSALRKLGSFCVSQSIIAENIFESLKTLSQSSSSSLPEYDYHLEEFKSELWKNGASKITVKNYLGDVKQYLAWSEKQQK